MFPGETPGIIDFAFYVAVVVLGAPAELIPHEDVFHLVPGQEPCEWLFERSG